MAIDVCGVGYLIKWVQNSCKHPNTKQLGGAFPTASIQSYHISISRYFVQRNIVISHLIVFHMKWELNWREEKVWDFLGHLALVFCFRCKLIAKKYSCVSGLKLWNKLEQTFFIKICLLTSFKAILINFDMKIAFEREHTGTKELILDTWG